MFIFGAAAISIVPLVVTMARSTGALAETSGSGIGGLLNATCGTADAMWASPPKAPRPW